MTNPNSIFGYNDVNYNTIFNMPLKTGLIVLGLVFIGAFSIIFSGFNLMAIIISAIIIIPIISILLTPVGEILYSSLSPGLKKYNQDFITKYLFSRFKSINGNIAESKDEKIVVMKIYAGTYFDKPEDEKENIKEQFNNLIIYNGNYIPKLIFRVINKKLNMKDYFDYFMLNNENLHKNIIYEEYYKNFESQYADLTNDINDFDYYIEMRFPLKTNESAIEDAMRELYNSIVASRFNISQDRLPEFLTGEEIYDYLNELAVGSTNENKSLLPIVSDFEV